MTAFPPADKASAVVTAVAPPRWAGTAAPWIPTPSSPSGPIVDGKWINSTAAVTKIIAFICPSDSNDAGLNNNGGNNSPQGKSISYTNNLGLNRYNNNWAMNGPS